SHISVTPDNSVTWNCERCRITGASAGNGTRRCGLSNRLRNLAVGTGFAGRDGLKIRPDPALEDGGLNIERKRGAQFLAAHLPEQIVSPCLHCLVVTAAGGERELVFQAVDQFLIGISEVNSADAFVGGGNQHASQGRIAKGVTNRSCD